MSGSGTSSRPSSNGIADATAIAASARNWPAGAWSALRRASVGSWPSGACGLFSQRTSCRKPATAGPTNLRPICSPASPCQQLPIASRRATFASALRRSPSGCLRQAISFHSVPLSPPVPGGSIWPSSSTSARAASSAGASPFHLRADLVLAALQQALGSRPARHTIFHSDRRGGGGE